MQTTQTFDVTVDEPASRISLRTSKPSAVQELLAVIVIQPDEQASSHALLKQILNSEQQKEEARQLKSGCAIKFMDYLKLTLDAIYDDIQHPLSGQKSNMRRLLVNVSKESGQLPTKLMLSKVDKDATINPFRAGFSDVYCGTYEGQRVSIKVLRAFNHHDKTEQAMRDFCREVLKCWTLRHKSLLPLIGGDKDEGTYRLISPWMQHGNLIHFQQKQTPANLLTSKNLVHMLCQIVDGLAYLHREDVVHGDVKGPNVLVDQDYNAFLCDFGLSIFSNATGGIQSQCGQSFAFAAPEQLNPPPGVEDLDQSYRTKEADIYAFAHLVLEAYTLQIPFFGCPPGKIVVKVAVNGERPKQPTLEECRGRPLPADLWSLVSLCWHQNPAERPRIESVHKELLRIWNTL